MTKKIMGQEQTINNNNNKYKYNNKNNLKFGMKKKIILQF